MRKTNRVIYETQFMQNCMHCRHLEFVAGSDSYSMLFKDEHFVAIRCLKEGRILLGNSCAASLVSMRARVCPNKEPVEEEQCY